MEKRRDFKLTVMMDSITLLMIGSKLLGLLLKVSVFLNLFMWYSDVGRFPSRRKMTEHKWKGEKGR